LSKIRALIDVLIGVVAATGVAAGGVVPARVAAESSFPAGTTAKVEAFIRAEMQREHIPGVALGIFVSGEPLLARGYGYANVELRVPVTPSTIFQTASVGKQFTAVAVMLLVQDGKLALDDSITRYFPDAPASWKPISIRHLLTHTSGLPDYGNGLGHGGTEPFDSRRDYTEEDLTKAFYGLPLLFEPGTRWQYSNSGYALLGFLVHRVSGRFYGDVLKERVFTPLGMKTARIISEEDIVANRAAGYRLVDDQLKNQEWYSPSVNTTADGSLYLTLLDYLAWDRGLRSQAILTSKSWAQIYAPVVLKSGKTYPYGFGWCIDESKHRPWYHHSGDSQGFATYISRYLADDLTIVALTNRADADTARIIDGVAAVLDPTLAKIQPSRSISDIDPAVTERVRALLKAAAAGTVPRQDLLFDGRELADELKGYVRLLHPLGAPLTLTPIDRRALGDDEALAFAAIYREARLRVQIVLAPDGRFADVDIRRE
jgi:CubicO group peptidase (beta-lactamase class C family)